MLSLFVLLNLLNTLTQFKTRVIIDLNYYIQRQKIEDPHSLNNAIYLLEIVRLDTINSNFAYTYRALNGFNEIYIVNAVSYFKHNNNIILISNPCNYNINQLFDDQLNKVDSNFIEHLKDQIQPMSHNGCNGGLYTNVKEKTEVIIFYKCHHYFSEDMLNLDIVK